MGLRIVENATAEPVTLAEAYVDLRVDAVDSDGRPDDDLIEGLISAARERCENFTGIQLAIKTYRLELDEFPADDADIEVPGPLISVEEFVHGFESDQMAMIDGVNYTIDNSDNPARLVAVNAWPTVTKETGVVRVTFVSGYGEASDAEPIPAIANAAIRVLIKAAYYGEDDAKVWAAVQSMIRPLKVTLGMA